MLNQKPEATPRPWFLLERRAPVRVRLGRLERLDQADRAELRPVGGLGALLGRVLEAQLDRVHAELARRSRRSTLSTANSEIGPPGAR